MKALVLFKGTGSVDRSLEALGFEVHSLDIDKKFNATWTANILDWHEWEQIEPGTYSFIWASCPCQQYSRARTTAKTPRDLVGSDAIVAKTLQIIEHLRPRGWVLENPATGLLKTREVVTGILLETYATADAPTESGTLTGSRRDFGVFYQPSNRDPCVQGEIRAPSP
jgi:site-specific DNA-cytosine methylase